MYNRYIDTYMQQIFTKELMKYNHIIKIALLNCALTISIGNICAATWHESFFSWIQKNHQAATQLATQLSSHWSHLTPMQQRLALGATAVALGSGGAYVYKRYQQRKELLQEINHLSKDIALILINKNIEPWQLAFQFQNKDDPDQFHETIIGQNETLLLMIDPSVEKVEEGIEKHNKQINNIHILTRKERPTALIYRPTFYTKYPDFFISTHLFVNPDQDIPAMKIVRNLDGSLDLQKLNVEQKANAIAQRA